MPLYVFTGTVRYISLPIFQQGLGSSCFFLSRVICRAVHSGNPKGTVNSSTLSEAAQLCADGKVSFVSLLPLSSTINECALVQGRKNWNTSSHKSVTKYCKMCSNLATVPPGQSGIFGGKKQDRIEENAQNEIKRAV